QGVEAAAGVSRCTHCTCCKSLHGGGGALQCNDSAPTPGRLLRPIVPCPETCRTASDPAGAYGGAVTRNPALVNHAAPGGISSRRVGGADAFPEAGVKTRGTVARWHGDSSAGMQLLATKRLSPDNVPCVGKTSLAHYLSCAIPTV